MTKKKSRIILFTIALIFLVGCSSDEIPYLPEATQAIANSTPIVSLALTSTPEPSATLITTKTRKPVPTATLTPPATPAIDIQLNENCGITGTVSVQDVPPEGTIVLIQHEPLAETGYLFDLANNHRIPLGEVHIPVDVSPNYQWFAYITNNRILEIVDRDGTILQSIPVPTDWYGVVNWVNNDNLLIEVRSGDPILKLASSFILNLETGEQKEYSSNYPGIDNLISFVPAWNNYAYTNAIYDPGFTRVIYLGDSPDGFLALNLWDLEDQRTVTRLLGTNSDCGGGPIWMKDGSKFISCVTPQFTDDLSGKIYANVQDGLPRVGGFDLALVSKDGEIERLTYLTTKYKAGEEGVSLSPDEKKLAFWLNLDYEEAYNLADPNEKIERQLAILDIKTGEITNLCFRGGDTPIPPVWSPDGRYLVVTVSDHMENTFDVFLIDLQQGLATKITEGAIAVGWMISPNE